MLEELLSGLELTRDEVKIYMHLLEVGASTAGKLASKLGMSRPTLYDTLQRMHGKGVVTRSLKQGVRTFGAEPPHVLNQLFKKRIETLQTQHQGFKDIIPMLEQKKGVLALAPRFQIFEGEEGLQHVLNDMLLYRNIDTYSYWPITSMVDILGAEFFRYHNKERIRNRLYTRAIWPPGRVVNIKKHPYLGAGKEYCREIRITPHHMDFTLGYWIYNHKVAMVSSRKECFGMLIESQEFVDMLLSQWRVIWDISKPMAINSADTAPFVKELLKEGII